MPDTADSWCVYILRLCDGRLYVGMTTRLQSRVAEHQAGRGPTATRTRLPVELVWYEGCPDSATARRLERWLKRRSAAEKRVYMTSNGTCVRDSE